MARNSMATDQLSSTQAWIHAARPRTLPLAIASIGLGAFLAAAHDRFSLPITLLAILTTLFLQVLSNLANDYGDSIHGADSVNRQGPARAVQSGAISSRAMRVGIGVTAFASVLSGLLLVVLAIRQADEAGRLQLFAVFVVLGAVALWGAINYTAGNQPYGYAGFGDAAVLIFFGWLGVLGTYFLQARTLPLSLFLPATSCGLFAVAVLNINNIRDVNSDRIAGKRSIPVRIGHGNAVLYHWSLLAAGFLLSVIYSLVEFRSPWQFLFVLTLPLLVRNGRAVAQMPSSKLDPYLKQMAITTLIYVLTFGVGQLLSGAIAL